MIRTVCFLVVTTMACSLAQAEPAAYKVDDHHTYVTFAVNHFGAAVNRGRLDDVTGSVDYDPDTKIGQIDITVHVHDIRSGSEELDQELLQASFFDAEKHPTMRFVSDKMMFNGDDLMEVPGTLTLLGQTHPMTLKANQFRCYPNPIEKVDTCGGDFEAVIDRTQWGMDYLVDMGMPKSVRVTATVEAFRQ